MCGGVRESVWGELGRVLACGERNGGGVGWGGMVWGPNTLPPTSVPSRILAIANLPK